MGIKENFTQAVKELTGIGKEKPSEKSSTVDEMKKAVEAGSDSATREITLDDVPDWDGSETSTIRPISQGNDSSADNKTESTPKAEAFLSGESVPVSLFGGSGRIESPMSNPQQSQQPTPQPEQTPFQPQMGQPANSQFSSQFSQQQRQYEREQYIEQQQIQRQQMQQSQQTQQQANVQSQQTSSQGGLPRSDGSFSSSDSFNRGGFQDRGEQRFTPSTAPVNVFRNPYPRTEQEDNELTIISKNTVVDGNIRSFADMSIDGDIKGDIETTKNIDLNGKIVGNLTCNNAMMHASQIQGSVRMRGNVSMKRDTLLMGDLISTYADVNGKIKGNLDIVGKIDLKGDAVVFGDISASTITVEDGAIIQGYVNTTFLNKEQSSNLFPETVTIGDNENMAGA